MQRVVTVIPTADIETRSEERDRAILVENDPFVTASFTFRNRLARAVWGMAWLLLFRFSPRPCHAWRALLLRLFGARLGKDVHVYPSVVVWAPWQLEIGDRVGIGQGANLYNMAKLVIGSNCVVSQGAHLCGGSHDIDSPNFQLIAAPIVIEEYVWVCAEAFVGPGVTLATGVVVGARGVAMKSIREPWTVWSGNPVVRRRNRKVIK